MDFDMESIEKRFIKYNQNNIILTGEQIDILNEYEIDKLYEKTGDVDILVLNASIQYKRKWDEFTLEEYDIQMNCNVKSSYLLIKKYAVGMEKKSWGRIVTVGSVNQYNQHPELSIYGVTKAAQKKMEDKEKKTKSPYTMEYKRKISLWTVVGCIFGFLLLILVIYAI